MPFALLIIGVVLTVVGVRDKQSDFYTLVKKDFDPSDTHSYVRWMFAILVIGSIGYIKPLQPISRAFLILVILVLFISNGGFFDRFNQEFFGATSVPKLFPSH